MAKSDSQLDVLVLGGHPSAAFCAALLAEKKQFRVLHATLPSEPLPERLVLVNPALFELHSLLSPLRRHLDLTPIYGARFLADDAQLRGEHHSRAGLSLVTSYQSLRKAMHELAKKQGVPQVSSRQLQIQRVTENGIEISINGNLLTPRMLVVAGDLSHQENRTLGIYDHDRDALHRYTFLRYKSGRSVHSDHRPVMNMSLDLQGMLHWAWLIQANGWTQIAVEQPLSSLENVSPQNLLKHWLDVLRGHGIISGHATVPLESAESIDMSFGGALVQESLANRTVLIGPAGGFYSSCGEDIYPNCWSALFAAQVIQKAMKETHLQDALDPFRSKWRTTLGEYLRGPQQNLRFLLPLIYRNPVMTRRLTEAILLGKSVVR